jgi:hypothetical protein
MSTVTIFEGGLMPDMAVSALLQSEPLRLPVKTTQCFANEDEQGKRVWTNITLVTGMNPSPHFRTWAKTPYRAQAHSAKATENHFSAQPAKYK